MISCTVHFERNVKIENAESTEKLIWQILKTTQNFLCLADEPLLQMWQERQRIPRTGRRVASDFRIGFEDLGTANGKTLRIL